MPLTKRVSRLNQVYQKKDKSHSTFKPFLWGFFVVILGYVVIGIFLKHGSLLTAQKTTPKPVKYTKTQTICLDPGHGGTDTGATYEDLTERDINLSVALEVRTILNKDGYQVFMTRTTNSPYLTNNDRVTYCNSKKATILVAIHQNDFTDNTTDYTLSLFYNTNAQSLAASLTNSTSSLLGITNDGIASFDDGELMRANMPATLIEGLFITNSQEYTDLTSGHSTRISLEAQGIVNGIENYFGNNNQQATQIQTLDQASPDNMP